MWVKDKYSSIIVLNTNYYPKKLEDQIDRTSFDKRDFDPSSEFKKKVIRCIVNW